MFASKTFATVNEKRSIFSTDSFVYFISLLFSQMTKNENDNNDYNGIIKVALAQKTLQKALVFIFNIKLYFIGLSVL